MITVLRTCFCSTVSCDVIHDDGQSQNCLDNVRNFKFFVSQHYIKFVNDTSAEIATCWLRVFLRDIYDDCYFSRDQWKMSVLLSKYICPAILAYGDEKCKKIMRIFLLLVSTSTWRAITLTSLSDAEGCRVRKEVRSTGETLYASTSIST